MSVNKNRERFVDLAEKRVTRVIKDLRLVGNLSNKSNYSYTQEDVQDIFRAINREMKDAKRRFDGGIKDNESIFKLPLER